MELSEESNAKTLEMLVESFAKVLPELGSSSGKLDLKRKFSFLSSEIKKKEDLTLKTLVSMKSNKPNARK